MSVTHYIEFMVNDKHASIGHCVSKLMTMLHGFMRHNKTNLGVSFPCMADDHIGDRVRVFGNKDQLQQLLENTQLQDACRRSICSLSVYMPTQLPDNKTPVRYIAARSACENISATFKRKLARYNLRHPDNPMSKQDQKKLKLYLANKSKQLPYFIIKGDEKLYPIYVEKKNVNSEALEFNSHGLGNLGGSVFDF